MSTTTLLTTTNAGIQSVWDYVTTLFSPLLVFGIALGLVAVIFYFIKRAPRKIF